MDLKIRGGDVVTPRLDHQHLPATIFQRGGRGMGFQKCMLTIVGDPLFASDLLLDVEPAHCFFPACLVQGRNVGIVCSETQNNLARRGQRSLPLLPSFRGLGPVIAWLCT